MQNDWHSLGEVSYRKWHVYDMEWQGSSNTPQKDGNAGITDDSLNNCIVCGAQFGGPLAVIKDTRKQSNAKDSGSTGPSSSIAQEGKLKIYTSAGSKMAEVNWDPNKKIVGMGWSDLENLVVVLDDGNILSYDIHGKLAKTSLLMDAVSSAHIVECHFWGNGVVAMASDMELHVAEVCISLVFSLFYSLIRSIPQGLASNDAGIRKYKLSTGLPLDKPYTAMAIVPPLQSRSGLLEVRKHI
jgi:hypothetical protein